MTTATDTTLAASLAALAARQTSFPNILSTLTALANVVTDINGGDLSATTQIRLGSSVYFQQMSNGDSWFTINAKYDGTNWQRLDITKYAFAMVWLFASSIPGEESFGGNTGFLFLRAVPASNPISSTYWSTGGWENIMIFDQFRHAVLGGQGIEIDGSGTFPYGRVVHNGSPTRTGIASNIYVDFSGTDDNTSPSWFVGRKGDGFIVERAPAASTSLSQLFAINNVGGITENAASVVGAGSPGTGLIAAVNIVTSVSGGSNVQLATASNPGQKQVIINTTASNVTVNPPASGTVAGAATVTMATNTQRTFYASASNVWW